MKNANITGAAGCLATWALAVVLGFGSGCAADLTAGQHYQAFQDGRSLHAVLQELKNGESKEKVSELLGIKTYGMDDTHRKGTFASFQMNPKDFPDGLKETDVILFYPFDDRGLATLIFRDGKLINHNPARYEPLKPDRSVKF